MLKTNSKKAVNNIQDYIMSCFVDPADLGYDGIETPAGFNDTEAVIYRVFLMESRWRDPDVKRYFGFNEFAAFRNWTQGLPSILNCGYYLCSAVNDLGSILEESDAEKAKYTESAAELLLTKLIYREIKKAVEK